MGKLTFNNKFKSGQATVHKVVVEDNKVIIWFKMHNEKIVRESYRLSYKEEVVRLKEAIKSILGELSEEMDTDILVDKPCIVELEERPWTEGRTWTGVGKVLPLHVEKNEKINTKENEKSLENMRQLDL